MKRKTAAMVLGICMAVMVCAAGVQAKTYGIDLGEGKTMQITVFDEGQEAVIREKEEDCVIADNTQKNTCAQERIEEYRVTCDEEGTTIAQEAEEVYTYAVEGEYQESEEKIREYQEHGIGYDEKSWCFTWEGTPIFWLMDEGGSICQNGSKEAKAGKIYVLVMRAEDGSVKEVKKITAEEVLREQVLRDASLLFHFTDI